jgi:hypothetical protein
MCILCSEEIIKNLKIEEVRKAGLELIFADGVDKNHVVERIEEIEREREDD